MVVNGCAPHELMKQTTYLKNNKNKDNDICYPSLYVGINRMCTYAFFQPVMTAPARPQEKSTSLEQARTIYLSNQLEFESRILLSPSYLTLGWAVRRRRMLIWSNKLPRWPHATKAMHITTKRLVISHMT